MKSRLCCCTYNEVKRDLYILETELNKEEIETILKEAKDDSMTIQVKKDSFYITTYHWTSAYAQPPGSHRMTGRIEPMEVGSRIILEADKHLSDIIVTKIVLGAVIVMGVLCIIKSKSIGLLIVALLWLILMIVLSIARLKGIGTKCAKFEDRILEFLESKLDARRYEE